MLTCDRACTSVALHGSPTLMERDRTGIYPKKDSALLEAKDMTPRVSRIFQFACLRRDGGR